MTRRGTAGPALLIAAGRLHDFSSVNTWTTSATFFDEKDGWYEDAADAREEWGSPISVMMAIMHQESRFKAKAKPPRKKILGFIPGPAPLRRLWL